MSAESLQGKLFSSKWGNELVTSPLIGKMAWMERFEGGERVEMVFIPAVGWMMMEVYRRQIEERRRNNRIRALFDPTFVAAKIRAKARTTRMLRAWPVHYVVCL